MTKLEMEAHRMIDCRPTSFGEASTLRPWSFSACEAGHTCERWGVVTVSMGKVYDTEARALALEAGGTMHDVFAAVRIWEVANIQKLPQHALFTLRRIFSPERSEGLSKTLFASKSDLKSDEHLLNFAYDALHTAGYYDDPRDDIRTLSNMEASTIKYVREMEAYMEGWPVYIEDRKRPNCIIGIEQNLDTVIEYADGKVIRFIGTIDTILDRKKNARIYVGDNKTASRLDDAWIKAWDMSHQLTGYMKLASVFLRRPIDHAKVFGVKIKPTNYNDDFLALEPAPRTEEMYQTWARWVRASVEMYERIGTNYEQADTETNACNRYFRACSLIPFCTASAEGRRKQILGMMDRPPSPSERAILFHERR